MKKTIVLLMTAIMAVSCMSPAERRIASLREHVEVSNDSAQYYINMSELAYNSSVYYIRQYDTAVAIAYFFMAKKCYNKAVIFTQQTQAYTDSLQMERDKL